MGFWEGFYQLPLLFVMAWLSAGMVGIFLIGRELINRKLSISKTGVTFDRLKPKKDGWLFWRREAKKKIPISEV